MKTDLQKAALQKLARLTQLGDHLPPHSQGSLHERLLKTFMEQKKLSNGVNGGINGVNGGLNNSPGRVLVSPNV